MKTQLFLPFVDMESLTAAGIVKKRRLVLMPSFLPYTMYVDTVWLQAGRQATSTAAHLQCHSSGCLSGLLVSSNLSL